MASWNITTKHEPNSINNGNRYEKKDRLSLENVNAITENSFYAVNEAEKAIEIAKGAAQGNGTILTLGGEIISSMEVDETPQESGINKLVTSAGVANALKNFTPSESYDDTELRGLIDGKVDKVDGKGLSTNDYTNADKTKLDGLKNYDDSVLDTRVKASVVGVAMNSGTGVFTFTRDDGTSFVVDTLLEKVVTNFTYNSQTQSLELTLEDGTTQSVPMSAFIDDYAGVDGDIITISISNDNQITATVKNGTITLDKLTSTLQTQINSIDNKVDKVTGKGLSTNDFTTAYKSKLDSLENYDDAEVLSQLSDKLNSKGQGSVGGMAGSGTFTTELSTTGSYLEKNYTYINKSTGSTTVDKTSQWNENGFVFINNLTGDYIRPTINNTEQMAYLSDVDNKASLDASNLSDSNVASWKEKLGVGEGGTKVIFTYYD